MNKHKAAKKDSVASLIARSRFVIRTEFFDAKAVIHDSHASGVSDETGCAPGGFRKSNRLVIAVPRRIGSAPVRNRCRRRIKELVRTMGLIDLPCDLIFFVRMSCAEIPLAVLRDFLEKIHRRVKKMCIPLQ